MGKVFAAISAFIGGLVALTASGACYLVFFEETEIPESLIR